MRLKFSLERGKNYKIYIFQLNTCQLLNLKISKIIRHIILKY